MTPREKAREITNSFKDFVNPYIGSGMLSNTHDDDAILWQCKKCAIIAANEAIDVFKKLDTYARDDKTEFKIKWEIIWWQDVRKEIEKL